jgi:hypothetical protein
MALVRLHREQLLGGDAEIAAVAAGLPEAGAMIVHGWRLEALGNWEGLRALEPRFAAIEAHDPAYPDAQRLRARWRLEAGDRALLEEGLALIDRRLLPLSIFPDDAILRARLSVKLGNGPAALSALNSAMDWTQRSAGARTAAGVRDVLRVVPPTPEHAAFRRIIERRSGYTGP